MDTNTDEYYVFDMRGRQRLEEFLNRGARQGWEVVQVLMVENTTRVVFRNPAKKVDPSHDSHSAFDEPAEAKEAETVTVRGLTTYDKADVVRSYRVRGWEILDQKTNVSSSVISYDITFRKF